MEGMSAKVAYHEVRVAGQDVMHHLLQLALADNLGRIQVEGLEEVLILLAIPQPAQPQRLLILNIFPQTED